MTNNYTPSDAAIFAARFAARTESATLESSAADIGEVAVRAAATQIAIDVLRDIRTSILDNTPAAALFSMDDDALSPIGLGRRDAYEVAVRTIEARARTLGAEVR
jgi:uncharacterized protein YjiS (DUF1127 family)